MTETTGESLNPQAHASLIQPGTTQELHAFGDTLTVLLSGEQTGGTLILQY